VNELKPDFSDCIKKAQKVVSKDFSIIATRIRETIKKGAE
jgi:hypothetical protein